MTPLINTLTSPAPIKYILALELEGVVKIMRGLEFKTAGSLVVGKFENDVTAIVTPENNPTAVKKVNLYTEGLYVSEFPQQQVTFQINYRVNLGPD